MTKVYVQTLKSQTFFYRINCNIRHFNNVIKSHQRILDIFDRLKNKTKTIVKIWFKR